MNTYKPTTSLDSEGEKGIRPSSGISASAGLISSSDAQQQANDGYRAADERRRNKEAASAVIESAADFFEAFGFSIEVTPDDAGRVVFGDNRITIELTPKEVEEADAAEEAAAVTHAFKLSDATAAGVAKVKILFGMVNGVTPTSMTAPSLTLTVSASGYVVLAVTTNTSGVATSAAISIAASMPSDSATLGHIALGYVTKNTGPTSVTCSQSVSGSLAHMKCGATTHLFGSV